MNRNDLEDATARALDLLPPDDPACSDPRLLRDPRCAEEIRATREAAADVWLATSPLRAAPPEVLPSLMARIEVRTPYARRNARFFPWLAASGWAAAALAMLMWPEDGGTSPPPAAPLRSGHGLAAKPAAALEPDAGPLPGKSPGYKERWLRDELLKVQSRLANLNEKAMVSTPRVLTLASPEGVQRSPEEARQRVWSVLTAALRSALEAESSDPADPADLVIERGWLPEGIVLAEGGGVIRHRNFPVDSWQQLGLQKSDDGRFYDPARDLVWTKEAEGRGYVGRRPVEEDDLGGFKDPDEGELAVASVPRTDPEGFVIEDPESDFAEVVIDQVPAPEEGNEQFVVWTDDAGRQNTVKVDHPAASPAPGASTGVIRIPASSSVTAQGASTLMLSIPNSGGVKAFQLVESPVKPNGKPARVIVAGERGPKRKPLR